MYVTHPSAVRSRPREPNGEINPRRLIPRGGVRVWLCGASMIGVATQLNLEVRMDPDLDTLAIALTRGSMEPSRSLNERL